jgi:hypothetical protein
MPILSPNDTLVRDVLKTGSKAAALEYIQARSAKIAKTKSCDPSAVERSIIAHVALNAPYAGKEALDTLAKWLGEEHFKVQSNVVNLGPSPAPLVKRLRARRGTAGKSRARR